MTHTTTDAAEARALIVTQADRDAAAEWRFIECRSCSEYEGDFEADLAVSFAEHRLATAEAASGAGEREAIARFIEPNAWDCYDATLRPFIENRGAHEGESWHVRAYQAGCRNTADARRWWLETAENEPVQVHLLRESLTKAKRIIASLPPATDPAIPDGWKLVPMEPTQQQHNAGNMAQDDIDQTDARVIYRAMLAAAPTIPATGEAGALAKMTALDEEIEAQHPGWMTGEAIPEGMKPWLGGDAPPDDWDGGRVLFRCGSMIHGCDVASWQHPWAKNVDEEPSMPSATTPFDIIAYTPKATIPATGHAATEGEGA